MLQSKVKQVGFHDRGLRDLAFLLLNGKIMFAWWRAIGGDLDLTAWMFGMFPFAVSDLPDNERPGLLELAGELERRLPDAVSYKLNAGKNVGTYRLQDARDITDRSDVIFARLMGIDNAWPDIELTYAETVKGSASHERLQDAA